ncbi:MAG: DUF4268 domain-containing protein, partial [Armatimonadia bacterium]|nr:DUF4268 domain-containing protein [Armatimonadia bacterium]
MGEIPMTNIGRIKRVDLREVWPHEAYDFTQWLGENLDVLSEELGIMLTDAETEGSAGDFSVDVIARDDRDRTVVIENQLERSDHDHLGKLLTYFAMMNAEAAIWIVSEARPEHVSAVSWLNENSDADFYLVQVEAIKIEGSPPAPLVRRVVGPSVETRKVRDDKRKLSETQRVLHQFWTELLERASDHDFALHSSVSAQPRHYLGTSVGKGLGLGYHVTRNASRVHLYIDRGSDKGDENEAILEALHEDRESIEAAFKEGLTWERLDQRRACRISYEMDNGGYEDEDRWPEIHESM